MKPEHKDWFASVRSAWFGLCSRDLTQASIKEYYADVDKARAELEAKCGEYVRRERVEVGAKKRRGR